MQRTCDEPDAGHFDHSLVAHRSCRYQYYVDMDTSKAVLTLLDAVGQYRWRVPRRCQRKLPFGTVWVRFGST
jgi:hypothetical protein